MARLKVFGWSDGFHSWTVATSSRPKALEAWGADQDLFKTGLAHEIQDGPEHEAALASPGTVIRTGMAIDPGVMGAAPSRPKRAAADRRAAESRAKKLRARIEALDARAAGEVAALQNEQAEIDKAIERIKSRLKTEKAALAKQLEGADRDARD